MPADEAPVAPWDAWSPVPASARQVAAVAIVILLATLPFLNKAYHIDDVLYLHGAYQVLRGEDSFHGQVLWDAKDGLPAPLFEIDHNPPLWKYLLAGTIRYLAPDRAEWKLHLLESFFVALAGVGLFQAGRRFCRTPAWSVAMILWSPFFLPGQNLMLEGPLLAFAAWTIEFATRAWQTGRVGWSWLAGILAAAAVMTKYTGGMLLVLLAVGALLARRPRTLVALVSPVAVLAAYWVHNLVLYQAAHVTAHGLVYKPGEWFARVFTELRILGGLTFFGPVLAVAWLSQGRAATNRILVVGAALMAAVAAAIDFEVVMAAARAEGWVPRPGHAAHQTLFTFHGAFLAALGVALAIRASGVAPSSLPASPAPRQFLALWIVLLFVFNVTSVPFQAVRHMLLLFVPLTWWVAGWLDGFPRAGKWRAGLLLASTMLGFSLAAADYSFAGVYRAAARDMVRRWREAGSTVWFTGNWGFAYYASQEGALPLLERPSRYGLPPVATGDIVVNPRLITFSSFPPAGFPPVRALEHAQPLTDNPFRTVAPATNFYSVAIHSLPWEWLMQPPHPDEPDAFFELPVLDDILVFEVVGEGPQAAK